MAEYIDPRNFVKDRYFDGAFVGEEIDWEAYHAACDRRDAKPKLRMIACGGRPKNSAADAVHPRSG